MERLEARALFAAGALDPSFGGGDGKVLSEFGNSSNRANDMAVFPEGRFVVSGAGGELVGYNADGSRDATFGGDGVVVPWNPLEIDAIAAAAGGRIVSAGRGIPTDRGIYQVARFNRDGSPDTSFGGGDGWVELPSASFISIVNEAVVQDDGKIVLVGQSWTGPTPYGFRAVRLNADGSIDTSFGRGGADGDGAVTVFFGYDATAQDVAVRPNGRILLAGYARAEPVDSDNDFAVAQLMPDGSPDTSFGGGDGKVLTNTPSSPAFPDDRAGGVALMGDGRFVVGGASGVGLAVVRYLADGSVDTTFGDSGVARSDFSPRVRSDPQPVQDVAVWPDGRVAIAANSFVSNNSDFAVAQFTPDGRPDPAFGGGDGKATVDFGGDDIAVAVAVVSPGRLLVTGTRSVPSQDGSTNADFAIARLAADGSLDPTFGAGGKVTTDVGPNAGVGTDVAIQPDGKIVLVGTPPGDGFAVERRNPDGSLDTSFGGGDGQVTIGFLDAFGSSASAVAIGPDAKIYVAGTAGLGGPNSQTNFGLARFLPDGTLDTSFGPGGDDLGAGYGGDGGGKLWVNITGDVENVSSDEVTGMVILPDGTIVLVGSTQYPGNPDIAVVRVTPAGLPDRSFGGGDGITTTRVGGPGVNDDDFGIAVDALPGGDVVVLAETKYRGENGDQPPVDFALFRYKPDGSLDRTFGNGNSVLLSRSGIDAADVAVLGGKILVAGTRGGHFAATRFNGNGTIDTTFGPGGADGDGVITTNFAVPSGALEIAGAPGGEFYLAGHAGPPPTPGVQGRRDFALARYNADGSPDTTFGGGDGAVTTDFGADDLGFNVALAPGGKPLVVGLSLDRRESDTAMARYLAEDETPPTEPQTYQAEDARLSGAVVQDDHPGYTGAGYADYTNASADYVEFTVQVPSAGRYALEFRYANGGSTDRPLIMSVNNSDGLSVVNFRPTGSWTTWRVAATEFPLNAGANTIRLTAAGKSGPNLDALTVRPIVSMQTYEAEQATLSGPVVARDHPGYTGTGYADFVRASGDFIEWTVTASETRQYVLDFRYANGSTLDRALRLTSDGAVVRDRLSFLPTTSWSNWRTVRVQVMLTAGTHKIRLTAVGRSGPNIDSMTVYRDPIPGA